MARDRIRATIEDGPRGGETIEIDAVAQDRPPKEFLLADEHLGARSADDATHPPSGAVSTYRLVGPNESGDAYRYRLVPHD